MLSRCSHPASRPSSAVAPGARHRELTGRGVCCRLGAWARRWGRGSRTPPAQAHGAGGTLHATRSSMPVGSGSRGTGQPDVLLATLPFAAARWSPPGGRGTAGPCVQSDPRGSEPQVVLAPQDNGLSSESLGGPAGCGRVSEIAGDGDSPQRDQPQAPSARALPWKWSFRVLLVRPTPDAQICPLKEKSGRRRPRHGAGHPSRAERVCGLVLMKGPLYPGTPRLQPPQALGASQQPGSLLRSGKVGFSARSAGSGLPTKGVYTAGVGLRPQDRPLHPQGRQGLISAQSLRLPFSRRPFPAKPLGRSGVAT